MQRFKIQREEDCEKSWICWWTLRTFNGKHLTEVQRCSHFLHFLPRLPCTPTGTRTLCKTTINRPQSRPWLSGSKEFKFKEHTKFKGKWIMRRRAFANAPWELSIECIQQKWKIFRLWKRWTARVVLKPQNDRVPGRSFKDVRMHWSFWMKCFNMLLM